jgi:excisionase family DNA binding protein
MLTTDREHPPRALLTVSEVASMLGCGRTLVYDLIGCRQLPVVKVGRLTRVPVAGVDAFVSRHLTEVRTISSSPDVIPDGRSRQAELFHDLPPRRGRRDGI